MENNISANITEVAKPFRLAMNLQLFAGDDVEVMDEPVDEVEEEQQTEEITDQDEGDNDPAPAKQEPERDLEKDSAFAEMRRKAEAAETKLQQLEQQRQKEIEIARKYGQYGVFSDDDVSKKYGSDGIHSLADLDRELQRQEYVNQGIDPDLVEKIVKESIDNHPSVLEAKRIATEQRLVTSYTELTAEFPDLVKSPSDVSAEVWQKWNNGESGLSLADSFALVNRKTIFEKQQAANIQAAKNQLNSKSHLKPNGGGGSELDTDSIPDDVLREYRRMFPKGTDAEFVKDYKKNNKK